MEHIKVLIIGSGPAGYRPPSIRHAPTCSPYSTKASSRADSSPRRPKSRISRYPEGVDGNQMMADLRRQAERFGTDIRSGQITRIDLLKRPFHVTVDGRRSWRPRR